MAITQKTQMWEKTNDKVGLREAQPIFCPICANRESPIKSKMVMRRSRIHVVGDVRLQMEEKGEEVRPYAVDLAFKCPICDFYCVFGVPIEIDYAQHVIQMREGQYDFVLPDETWNEEEEVKKRLKALGYW